VFSYTTVHALATLLQVRILHTHTWHTYQFTVKLLLPSIGTFHVAYIKTFYLNTRLIFKIIHTAFNSTLIVQRVQFVGEGEFSGHCFRISPIVPMFPLRPCFLLVQQHISPFVLNPGSTNKSHPDYARFLQITIIQTIV